MSDRTKVAYVEILFSEKTKQFFSNLVSDIVPEKNLYHSPVMPHIKGDVTSLLHLTVFFGLDIKTVDNPKFIKLIEDTQFSQVQISKLILFNGYQNLYKILGVEIVDAEGKLLSLSKNLENFVEKEKRKNIEFKPHLTLAYVTNDFQLPDIRLESSTLECSSLRVSIFEKPISKAA